MMKTAKSMTHVRLNMWPYWSVAAKKPSKMEQVNGAKNESLPYYKHFLSHIV